MNSVSNFITYNKSELSEEIVKTFKLTNCLKKYSTYLELAKVCYQKNYEDLVETIINHLNTIPEGILGKRCGLCYYHTYLLYYYNSKMWDKAIQIIYKINSFDYKTIDDEYIIYTRLASIYHNFNLDHESLAIINKLLEDNIFPYLDDDRRMEIYIHIIFVLLYLGRIDEVNKYYEKLESLNINRRNKKINFYLDLFAICIRLIHDDNDITICDDYLKLIKRNKLIISQELKSVKTHILFLEILIDNGYNLEARKTILFYLNLTHHYENIMQLYNLLFKCYPNKAPASIMKRYYMELEHYYEYQKEIMRKSIIRQIEYCNLEYRITQQFIELSCDPLTGCINHNRFEKLINQYLEQHNGGSLVIFELNELKKMCNATIHFKDDDILNIFSEKVKECVHGNVLFCRYEKDKYILMLSLQEKDKILEVINNIQSKMNGVQKLVDYKINSKFDFGFAIYDPYYCESAIKMINKADQQLFKYKNIIN